MEKEELIRVGNSFAEADAFPLRVGINYLSAEQAAGGGEAVIVKARRDHHPIHHAAARAVRAGPHHIDLYHADHVHQHLFHQQFYG